MTRPRPAVRMALAGMVMVVMACDAPANAPPATQAPASEGVTTLPPSPAPSPAPSPMMPRAQVKPVTVVMSGSACGHHVLPPSERLKKNRDALGWRIRNNCAAAQKVLICAYRDRELFNPFLPCVSNPTAGLDIGTAFTVEGGKREDLDCEANVPGSYKKVVLVGGEVPSSGCPGVPLKPEIILTHRLDIEIIP